MRYIEARDQEEDCRAFARAASAIFVMTVLCIGCLITLIRRSESRSIAVSERETDEIPGSVVRLLEYLEANK